MARFPLLWPRTSSSGVLAGGQAGYNYQINQWVLGVEGDFDYFNAEKTRSGGPISATSITSFSQTIKQTWFATVRGRLGWAFDHLLVYGTGGAAFSQWQGTGWTAGGGVEYAVDQHWSLKAEYLYSDFGNVTGSSVFPSPPNGAGFTHTHNVNNLITQLARAGVNYKFW